MLICGKNAGQGALTNAACALLPKQFLIKVSNIHLLMGLGSQELLKQ